MPFSVVTDADIRFVYWFLNDAFIGKSRPDKPFLWQARPGHYTVRVIDDHGLADAKDIRVQIAG